MSFVNAFTIIFCLAGAVFFLAGTVGLLRFPDIFSRLHALTKADNLGLGLIVIGLLFQVDSFSTGLKMLFIWSLALAAGSNACYAIGRYAFLRTPREKTREASE